HHQAEVRNVLGGLEGGAALGHDGGVVGGEEGNGLDLATTGHREQGERDAVGGLPLDGDGLALDLGENRVGRQVVHGRDAVDHHLHAPAVRRRNRRGCSEGEDAGGGGPAADGEALRALQRIDAVERVLHALIVHQGESGQVAVHVPLHDPGEEDALAVGDL